MSNSKFLKIISVGVLALALVVFTGGIARAVTTVDANSVTNNGALTITGAAASTWSTSTGALTLTGTGGLTLDSGTTTAVNLGTAAAAKTVTVGNAASTEVEINALLVDINAGATGMTVDFGAGNLVITGAGASADFTLDSDLISIDGTGTSNITVTGADGEDFTIAQAGAANASLFLSSTGTGADALTITVSGASGDIQVDATAGTVIVDGGEAVADALLLRATGGTTATAHLTSNGTGTAAVDIDATGTGGDVDIDAVDAIDLLAGGVFSIDGTGASNVSATSGNLTLSTITTGVLILSSAGNTTLDVATGGLLSIDIAAPGIEVATANNISVAASDSIGTVAQTFVIELTGAEDDEDDFTIRAVGANGELLLTSGDDLLIDAVGLLELNSSAGVISIGNDAVNQNINIGTAGTRTIAVGSATTILNATAADASYINLGAVIHNDAAAQGLKLPNSAGAPTAITANPEGFIAWDATNNLLYVSTDAGWASTFTNTASANTWTDNQIYTFAGDEDIAITSDLGANANILNITVTPNASSFATQAIKIDQAASANTNGLDTAIEIDNSDDSAAITAGVLFTSAGGAITAAIDASASQIVAALSIGANTILSTGTVTFNRADSGTVTLTAVDDNADAALTISSGGTGTLTLDGGGASAIVIGSADVTSLTAIVDNDFTHQNGATGNVTLDFRDYADSADDDMAHAILTVNCTDATTGAEDCDLTIGVVEAGAVADTRLNIDADGGVTIGSVTNNSFTVTTDGTGDAEVVLPNLSVGELELTASSGTGLGVLRTARAKYDFAVDGGVVGAITPASTAVLPDNAVMVGATINSTTAVTAAGAATLAVGTTAGSSATAILGATGKASLGADALVNGTPVFSTPVKMSAAGSINVTVGTDTLTAGVVEITVFYFVAAN